MDGLFGRHKIRMRSRKWYIRLFHHLLDVTIINSWLLHRKIQHQKGNGEEMPLAQFREELAVTLSQIRKPTIPKRGRLSTEI